MSTLPQEIKLQISRAMPINDKLNVDDLLKILRREIESREICFHMSGKKNSGTSDHHEKKDDVDEEQTTGSTLLSTEAFYNNRSVSCTYCKRNHTTSKCDVITDVPARKAILRKKARCFVCLKAAHIARQCTSTARCFKCNGRHHISICEQPRNYTGNRNVESTTSNPAASKYGQYSGVTTTQKSTTLLQTAQANVISDTGKSTSIRLLFDSCSQKSFINSKIRLVLNLPLLRKERMVLKAFESSNEEPRVIDVVRAKIKGINKSITVDVELCRSENLLANIVPNHRISTSHIRAYYESRVS